MKTVKVGPKGRHIQVKEGWRILSGDERMKRGDLVANIYHATWEHIDKEDEEMDAEVYDLVIREDKFPELKNRKGKLCT